MAAASNSQVCFNIRDKGSCSFGSNCRFLHPGADTRGSTRKATQLCYTLRDEGSCSYGDNCRFSHDLKLVEAEKAKPAAAAAKPAAAAASTESRGRGRGRGRGGRGRRGSRGGRGGRGRSGSRGGSAAGSSAPAASTAPKTEAKAAASETKKAAATPAPAGAGRLTCYQFKTKGACEFGERCRFLHEGAGPTRGSRLKSTEVCYSLRDEGSCKFGADCRYSHDLKGAAAAESSAPASDKGARRAPRQPRGGRARADKICYRWEESGECEWGDECRFIHAAD